MENEKFTGSHRVVTKQAIKCGRGPETDELVNGPPLSLLCFLGGEVGADPLSVVGILDWHLQH